MNTTHIEDWLDYADSLGLQIVEVTEGRNGFPKNLSKAVIGFDTWEDAEKFTKETERQVVRMTRRDGHQFWFYKGRTFEPLKPTAEWFGDEYCTYDNEADWWNDAKGSLSAVLSDIEDIDSLQSMVNDMWEIHNEFDKQEDDEMIVLCGNTLYGTQKKQCMCWHDTDVTSYVIAVK